MQVKIYLALSDFGMYHIMCTFFRKDFLEKKSVMILYAIDDVKHALEHD